LVTNYQTGHHILTGIWSLIILLGVKIIHLVDRTNLFKISNLVQGGKETNESVSQLGGAETDS
jgi:hypothetical protein